MHFQHFYLFSDFDSLVGLCIPQFAAHEHLSFRVNFTFDFTDHPYQSIPAGLRPGPLGTEGKTCDGGKK